jgi:hypothetical protein
MAEAGRRVSRLLERDPGAKTTNDERRKIQGGRKRWRNRFEAATG